MKQQIKISLLFVMLAFFASCDYIITPLKPRVIVLSNDTTKVYKNVLVEDYTGGACGNCPPAGAQLDSLIAIYGSRIIPLSVNAGPTYAVPQPTYTLDLQSTAGDAYDGTFQMSAVGNPCGMVNRKGNPIASKYLLYTQWPPLAQSIITNDTAFIKLTLSTTFDATSRALTVTATSTFLKALSGQYNLVVLLTEDSIMGPQKSGTNGTISNYAHRFVLRDAINGTWGDILVTAGSSLNQVITITKTYPYTLAAAYPLPSYTGNTGNKPPVACNFKNCSVVAYIYDATTGSATQYEVFQAEQKKIYP